VDAWYLILTKPRRERAALDNLERQGFRTYLPRVRSRRRTPHGTTRTVAPMFPRYLFVRLDDRRDDWGPIRSTIGVTGLVRFGGVPARVPDALKSALQSRDNVAGIQELPTRVLAPGERVRILDRALAGIEAIYQAAAGDERVILLLEMDERVVRLEVRAEDVEPV